MSKTLKYRWRTAPSGVEGTATVYVDGRFGSNNYGDASVRGTREHPYKTLDQISLDGKTPATIVCRGKITGDYIGNHSTTIKGDYYGACYYDGTDQNQIICCTHNNWIVLNSNFPEVDYSLIPYESSLQASVVGVGRANHAGNVSHAIGSVGFGSSTVLCSRSKLWRGCIGGQSSSCVWSDIQRNTPYDAPKHRCGVTLGSYQGTVLNHNIYHRCKAYKEGVIDARERRDEAGANTNGISTTWSIFSDFDIFIDDNTGIDKFYHSLFDKNCSFYLRHFYSENIYDYCIKLGNSVLEYSVEFDDENKICTVNGVNTIFEAADYLFDNGYLIDKAGKTITTKRCFFEDCVWTEQTEDDIFNNVDALDFTLKEGSAGYLDYQRWYGTFQRAKSLAIYNDVYDDSGIKLSVGSDEKINCFDNRTIDGCLQIQDGSLCYDETSESKTGSITSKIIQLDPRMEQITKIYSFMGDKIPAYGLIANKNGYSAEVYNVGDMLPYNPENENLFFIRGEGNIIYNQVEYAPNETIRVSEENTTFSLKNPEINSYLVHIIDPNPMNVIYVRCRTMIYAYASQNEPLIKGVTYYNYGDKNIIYRNRTIVPKESFKAEDNSYFTCEDSSYKIAIMFDDRTEEELNGEPTVVPTSEWVPAQLWGSYFVGKSGGNIAHDSDGIPYSSGNPLSWNTNTSVGNVGDGIRMSNIGSQVYINQPYVQVGIFINVEL